MIRRNLGILVAIVLAVAVAPLAVAQAQPSLKAIVTEIERQQNVKTIDQVNPDRVNEQTLAQLGDAVMDQLVPNERQHAYMDQMMGGEGSKTLEAMHAAMGYNYLANGGRLSWGAMPFGPGMMGNGYGFRGGAPGYGFRGGAPGYGPGYGYGPHMFGYGFRGMRAVWLIPPILVFLLVIAVVVLAVLLATRKRRIRERLEGDDDPLEILKRRYARGEISKEDYDRMKQDL
jgi:putative membrane protein